MNQSIDELLNYLFEGQPHPLAPPVAAWLASSRRFTAFVTSFRDKIRKKLRSTQEPESLLDLGLELETAYLLLQERALSLVYEPQPRGQGRHPDFAVTFTTSLVFMVEVTRLRAAQDRASRLVGERIAAPAAPGSAAMPPFEAERLADTICGKVGQLLPQHSNILVVGVDAPRVTSSDLRAAMLQLQQRAERNDRALLQRHRFRDRADFFQQYQRLSEVLVRGPQLRADEPAVVWVNPQAKHALPARVRTALHHSHMVEGR